MPQAKIYNMTFASVYPFYVKIADRRTGKRQGNEQDA